MIDYKTENAEIVEIGRNEATFLLNLNTKNRKVNNASLSAINDDVVNGKFMFNGASIVVSNNGILIDGQHRLIIVEKTGIPIKTVLVTGVEEKAMGTLDIGKKRTCSDILSMNNIPSSTGIASMVRLVKTEFGLNKKYVQGFKKYNGVPKKIEKKMTPNEALEEYQDNYEMYSDAYSFAERIYQAKSSIRLKGLSSASIGAYYILFSREDKQSARSFLREILSGVKERESNVCTLLRNKIINLSIRRESITPEKMRDLMISAFRKYKDDRTVKSLVARSGSFIKNN